MAVKVLMDAHVEDCLVLNYEPIETTLNLPDKKDHHILGH